MNESKTWQQLNEDEKFEVFKDLYYNQEKTMNEIAGLLKAGQTTLKKYAEKKCLVLRTKSESQALALKQGKAKHPTQGQKRDEATKQKIGRSRTDYYENMSEDDRKKLSEKGKENWDKLSEEDKEAFKKAGTVGILNTVKQGSKLEKAIMSKLVDNGNRVGFHVKQALLKGKLELDLVLTDHKIAIEVDGPSHNENVWGKEKFEKRKVADAQKDALAVMYGFVLIRVKHKVQNISNTFLRELSDKVLEVVNKVKEKRPTLNSEKVIVIEG